MTPATTALAVPAGYAEWLRSLKAQIAQARQRAALSVNAELVGLYARIGHDILRRQQDEGWGAKVIDRLARDLKAAFPDMRGWSSSNLKYMRFFAQQCPDGRFGQQPADQLPWFHVVTLLTRLAEPAERAWYAERIVQQGWSRTTLELQIKNRLHLRQGAAVTNFEARLPAPDADLAHETLKDPYLFDFLGLGDDAKEREIERGLVAHITRFLLELGAGFAFLGRQRRIEVAGDEFFIDLLFYHTRLKCHVVVELKATAFKPEHAGQLNFYLSAVDAAGARRRDARTARLPPVAAARAPAPCHRRVTPRRTACRSRWGATAGTRGDFARLVDWTNPAANDWLAVNQFSITRPCRTRRADIVLFVNGLPLALVELKNPADPNADVWTPTWSPTSKSVAASSMAKRWSWR